MWPIVLRWTPRAFAALHWFQPLQLSISNRELPAKGSHPFGVGDASNTHLSQEYPHLMRTSSFTIMHSPPLSSLSDIA
jgi:hypothetical protein